MFLFEYVDYIVGDDSVGESYDNVIIVEFIGNST